MQFLTTRILVMATKNNTMGASWTQDLNRALLGQFKLLFSTLFYASYRLTINFTCPVGRVLYEFQLSEAKTYSSQTRG